MFFVYLHTRTRTPGYGLLDWASVPAMCEIAENAPKSFSSMENTENWKPVKGYEGIYEVSDLGRVRSIDRVRVFKTGRAVPLKGVLRKYCTDHRGYFRVMLSNWGKKEHSCLIHRLVAEAFIPNPDGLPEVNHKDENKANNRADNLEWCTHRANSRYGSRGARISAWHLQNSPRRVAINQLTMDGQYIQTFPSQAEAARQVHGSQGTIASVVGRKKKSAYGYKWEYADCIRRPK